MAVDETTKKRIDAWIKAENRNEFGDAKGTAYAGGTPLFSEFAPGPAKDRYEYILERHPELREPKA